MSDNLIDQYLNNNNWRIKENSNTSYSFSGLKFYIDGHILADYALDNLPENIRNAHKKGDFHIHNLESGNLIRYCSGNSLQSLLMKGLWTPAVISKPAKHFNTAVDHVMNYLYMMQMEVAGAVAFNDVDTLLAPFIRADKLMYKEVKQNIQRLIFNLNFTLRSASQCIDEETEILTDNGWKGIDSITNDDKVLTININTKNLEYCDIDRIVKYDVNEDLINLYNKRIDQLVTKKHKVLVFRYWTNDIEFREAEKVFSYDSSWLIPLNANFDYPDFNISDNDLKLHAWILSEGHIRPDNRITITQSIVNQPYIEEIKSLLNSMNIPFKIYYRKNSGFSNNPNAQIYIKLRDFPTASKEFHKWFHKLSRRQCKLFLDEYRKGDGAKTRFRLYTNNKYHKDILIELAFKAGYNTSSRLRSNGVYDISIIRDFKDRTWNVRKKLVPYTGRVWCVTSKNQTMIIKRNNKVCITGNTPFTNFSFNFLAPKYLKDTSAIVGGKTDNPIYGDYQKEIDMFNTAFAEVLMDRDGSTRPFTFPIPTINLTKGIDFNSEAFRMMLIEDMALGSYYFMNYIGSGISEETVRAMCCRLNIDLSELSAAGGLWNMGDSTGSLGVVTLNLPRIGFLSKSDAEILEKIDYLMDLAKDELLLKEETLRKCYNIGITPFSKFYDLNLDHYFRTIGVLGLNELCLNYTGKGLLHNAEFGQKIIQHMRNHTKKLQKETGKLFNLEMTPAEGSSYRLARKDREMYNDNIKTLGTAEAPYYTSLLIPPSEELDVFERLKIEQNILPLFSGGTVFRVFVGDDCDDVGPISSLIQKISNSKVPYFDVTRTFSICAIENKMFNGSIEVCPDCGKPTEVYSRVVGYYRAVNRWNIGKQQEFKDRKYVSIVEE